MHLQVDNSANPDAIAHNAHNATHLECEIWTMRHGWALHMEPELPVRLWEQ
jgi:hypothetical protein